MGVFQKLLNLARPSDVPPLGEATSIQKGAPTNNPFNVQGFASAESNGQGFTAPPAGTYDHYRLMSSHPTVALIEAIATAPVRTNVLDYKLRPGGDEHWLELVKSVLNPQRGTIVREMLRALRMGWFGGEIIWDTCDMKMTIVDDTMSYRVTYGSGQWIAPKRVKPLRIDNTEILVDGNGNVLGLRNKSQGKLPVDLIGPKSLLYTYDGEAGNPYGRSRHENIRKHFAQAEQVLDRLGQYSKKVAGIILQLHYPDGTSKNASGADVSNYQIAREMLQQVADGKSVTMVNKFASFLGGNVTPAIIEKALASAGKSDWVFSFLDAGGTDFAPGLLDSLEYYDKCFCRGWLRPERTALEAVKGGSRADSVSHTDTAMSDSELIAWDIANCIREQIINPMLVANFGEDARDAVTPEPTPMIDSAGETIKDILMAGIANPSTGEEILRKIDIDGALDDLEVPIVDEERGPIGAGIDAMKAADAKVAGQNSANDSLPGDNASGKVAE